MDKKLKDEAALALTTTIAEMGAKIHQLYDTLLQERETLRTSNHVQLPFIGDKKIALLQEIENLDRLRVNLVRDVPETSTALSGHWSEFLTQLQSCAELDRQNGLLAQACLNVVKKALATLTGNDPVASTYGPRGKQETNLRSNKSIAV